MDQKSQSVDAYVPDGSSGYMDDVNDACVPDGSSGYMDDLKKNKSILRPVADGESGQGFPYAPENWPYPGDIWGWKAGKRTMHGFIRDRYLYLPSRLRKPGPGKQGFASKLSVREYILNEFPETNINAFFDSFTWRMPSRDHPAGGIIMSPKEEVTRCPGVELEVGAKDCKAGNKKCSLGLRPKSSLVPAMDCDICCSEPGFCQDCSCILCCKAVDWDYEGFSFIRCEAMVDKNYICGHTAHIDCALRCYLAGTVGGNTGLDAEYYCRRCDHRTDLIMHVTRILKVCQSLESRDEIEKILNLGFCILRGSQKENGKRLLLHVKLALTKLRSGICLEHIWNMEDSSEKFAGEASDSGNNGNLSPSLDRPEPPVVIAGDEFEIENLDEEIDGVLQDLRKSQEYEYNIAKKSLVTQKNVIVDLYKQIEKERSELARETITDFTDPRVTSLLNKVDQVKRENLKFMHMEEVAKGFGRVPTCILKEHFGVDTED